MILVTRADPAGIPLVLVCADCMNDPTTIWQRPADEFWATSLASWLRIHLRRSLIPPQQSPWVRTDRVPPEVLAAAKQLFGQASGAGSLDAHSSTAPDLTSETDLSTVSQPC